MWNSFSRCIMYTLQNVYLLTTHHTSLLSHLKFLNFGYHVVISQTELLVRKEGEAVAQEREADAKRENMHLADQVKFPFRDVNQCWCGIVFF